MKASTLASIARRMDTVQPWQFSEDNAGYKWLLAKQAGVLDSDMEENPTVASESVSAGSVSASTSYRTGGGSLTVKCRADIIEDAITLYRSGRGASPSAATATFGGYQP